MQSSAGEFTVAQGVYAATRTGWFSDRTVRYLATGRPAVVQDTGWADGLGHRRRPPHIPRSRRGAGGVETVSADLERHAKAARRVAEEHFSAELVLARFLELAIG